MSCFPKINKTRVFGFSFAVLAILALEKTGVSSDTIDSAFLYFATAIAVTWVVLKIIISYLERNIKDDIEIISKNNETMREIDEMMEEAVMVAGDKTLSKTVKMEKEVEILEKVQAGAEHCIDRCREKKSKRGFRG